MGATLRHTPLAEVMPAANGYGILEVIQADGTHRFLLKGLRGVGSSGIASHLNALPVRMDASAHS